MYFYVLIEPKHGFIKTAKVIINNAHLSLLGVLKLTTLLFIIPILT